MQLPKIIEKIAKTISQAGGQPILVGGGVRDAFMNQNTTDYDLEIFKITDYKALIEVLKPFGTIKQTGAAFSVVKLWPAGAKIILDIALPRIEHKISRGHKGFLVDHDPNISYKTAASRRDFTINSMGYDLISNQILDPFNGQKDIKNRVIRHIGPAFSEDPLRVLRAMQFAGRLGFSIDSKTRALCRKMDLSELPKERLFEEFKKLLLKSKKPSSGLSYFFDLGLDRYFPELAMLKGVPQDPIRHPEGDVWNHTLRVIDNMASRRTGDECEDLIRMLSALCHDFGKAKNTYQEDGKWYSRDHEKRGVTPTGAFLRRLTNQKQLITAVQTAVKYHSIPFHAYFHGKFKPVTNAKLRQVAVAMPLSRLMALGGSDFLGRPEGAYNPDDIKKIESHLYARATALQVYPQLPPPFISGHDLMKLGHKPSPQMGRLLASLFQKQLNRVFQTRSAALNYLKNIKKS